LLACVAHFVSPVGWDRVVCVHVAILCKRGLLCKRKLYVEAKKIPPKREGRLVGLLPSICDGPRSHQQILRDLV
jgi:hypothetical protein